MEFKHIPVLLNECIEGLNIKEDGIYVDGTVGGGGHSCEIAKKLGNKGTLVCIDKDKTAIEESKKRVKGKCKIYFANDDFENLNKILENFKIDKVDGILVDLGVSSYQIDNSKRGFSYMKDGPLDMRMDENCRLTAKDVVNNYSERDLIKILYDYGEEKFAKTIAKNIVEERRTKEISTTLQLVEIIKKSMPKSVVFKGGFAKKTFQAIRIEVNHELESLKNFLTQAVGNLNRGGRLCVITFHSLEDRITKDIFKNLSTGCICPKSLPVCVCHHKQIVKLVNKKPITPSEEEMENNKRSLSSKLRIVEKI